MEEVSYLQPIDQMLGVINEIKQEKEAEERARESIENQLKIIAKQNKKNAAALDIVTHAIEILRGVSDSAVASSYKFLEKSLNDSLKRMFKGNKRSIKIKESTYKGQYPQLEIEMHTEDNIVRSLKTDSGHGIAQIVSILCILNLIVITGARRIMVTDEVMSGLSVHNREIMSQIMWAFTDIGFQFIVNDHGFVPKGSKVHVFEMKAGVSGIKDSYISKSGVYLQGKEGEENPYSDEEDTADTEEDTAGGQE